MGVRKCEREIYRNGESGSGVRLSERERVLEKMIQLVNYQTVE